MLLILLLQGWRLLSPASARDTSLCYHPYTCASPCSARSCAVSCSLSTSATLCLLACSLVSFGFRRSAIDTCVYRYDGTDQRSILLLVYVDDLVCAYSHDDVRLEFIKYLSARLPVDDRGPLEWILRMRVERDRSRRLLRLDQSQYIAKMVSRFSPSAPPRAYDSPLDEEVSPLLHDDCPTPGSPEHDAMASRRVTYMSLVGALLWIAACTRPDLTYTVSTLARFCSNPGPSHYAALMRTLGYLHSTAHLVLCLQPTTSELEVYSDASWLTRNSVSGGLILYRRCPIAWWSRLQKSVSASTAEAETFAAALASREAIYVRDLLADLSFGVTRPTPLYLDSKAALDLAVDPVAFKKTKHILRHAFELRDRVARRLFTPSFVPSEDQLADIFTKALRVAPHQTMLHRLLSTSSSSSSSSPDSAPLSARGGVHASLPTVVTEG